MNIPQLPDDILYILASYTNKTICVSKFFLNFWENLTMTIYSTADELNDIPVERLEKIRILKIRPVYGVNTPLLPTINSPLWKKMVLLIKSIYYLSAFSELLPHCGFPIGNVRVLDLQNSYCNTIIHTLDKYNLECRNFRYIFRSYIPESLMAYLTPEDRELLDDYMEYNRNITWRDLNDKFIIVRGNHHTELYYSTSMTLDIFDLSRVKNLILVTGAPHKALLWRLSRYKNIKTVSIKGYIGNKALEFFRRVLSFAEVQKIDDYKY